MEIVKSNDGNGAHEIIIAIPPGTNKEKFWIWSGQLLSFPLGVLSVSALPHGRALTLYLPWSRLSTLTSHLSGQPLGCGLEEEKK
ncbi:hypothetical protein Scep_020383 [Stephania cephalantha]|uniref:Uncharacterized protein n=1 Tax=Stephania cephalantha TaxID=152367 RepID=A0AAP0ICI4_9MAGN